MGPPGSGKGSLSQMCIQHLGWAQLSTGALLRKHIAEKTEIGRQIDFAIKSGILVSDDLIVKMVEEWLVNHTNNVNAIILDGFPRTLVQAEALYELFKTSLRNYSLRIIRLHVSNEAVIKRLSCRATCQNMECQAVYSMIVNSSQAPKSDMICDLCGSPLVRRSDDKEESVTERLRSYYAHEKSVIEFFKNNHIAVDELYVEKPLHIVFDEFKKVIDVVV